VSEVNLETGLHYPIKLGELPAVWAADYVGAFSDEIESGFACGSHNQTGDGIQHLRPMNITSKGEINLEDARHVPADFNAKRLREDDVLFNNTNSPALVGKTAHIGKKVSGKAFSNHMTRVAFSAAVVPGFAARQLNFLFAAGYFLHRCVKHVNQASISSRELGRTVPLVLPPLAEQKRIVAKIEELFSELDAGEESLRRARRQLGVYRQSLLKQAFEGKLTAHWRAQNPDLLESPDQLLTRIQEERQARYEQQLEEWKKAGGGRGKPKKPKCIAPISTAELEGIHAIPSAWAWSRFGNLYDMIAGFAFKKSDYSDQGIRLFQIANVSFGRTTWEVTTYLPESFVEKFPELLLEEGDVVMALNRPMLGDRLKVTRLGTLDVPSILYQRLGKFIFHDPRVSDFFLLFLHSFYFTNRLKEELRGVNIPFINQTRLAEYAIPLCSLPEQQEIVRLLDEQFEVIEQNEREIDAALKRSEALRQSILKKAFTGHLVPQDPTDEPASALLARIREQRENGSKAPAPPRKRPGAAGRRRAR
jgi:type I restriction enzyme S subunit